MKFTRRHCHLSIIRIIVFGCFKSSRPAALHHLHVHAHIDVLFRRVSHLSLSLRCASDKRLSSSIRASGIEFSRVSNCICPVRGVGTKKTKNIKTNIRKRGHWTHWTCLQRQLVIKRTHSATGSGGIEGDLEGPRANQGRGVSLLAAPIPSAPVT